MKKEFSKELVDLSNLELNKLEGGSILTDITRALGWFGASGCKSYASMHDSGLLAYRH